MENSENSRRAFIKKTVAGTATLYAGSVLPAFSAGSYGLIMGASDKVNVFIMGVNSRGFSE